MGVFKFHHHGKNINIVLPDKIESVSSQIVTRNTFFEVEFLEHLRVHYGTQRTIVDIGANIGNHALFFSEFLVHNNIICFEPVESNLEVLRSNMIGRKCDIVGVALSDKNGSATLYNSDAGSSGCFSLERFDNYLLKSFVVQDSIPTRTLDSYGLEDVSMIKIDVENHELQVLEGARQTILYNKPMILVEDLHNLFPQFFSADRFDSFFRSVDYVKRESNIAGFYTDLWWPASSMPNQSLPPEPSPLPPEPTPLPPEPPPYQGPQPPLSSTVLRPPGSIPPSVKSRRRKI